MMRSSFRRVGITTTTTIAILLFGSWISQSLAADKTVPTAMGDLTLDVPAGWTTSNERGALVVAASEQKGATRVMISVLPLGKLDASDAGLKKVLQRIAAQYAEGAVEENAQPEPIGTSDADHFHGFVESFTDGSADPGEFKCVTSGILASKTAAMTVTILYNDKASPEVATAKNVLKNALLKSRAAADGLRLAAPDKSFDLTLPGKWEVVSQQSNGNSANLMAISPDNGMEVTIYIEPAHGAGNAADARKFYLERMKQSPLEMKNLKTEDRPDRSITSYQFELDESQHENIYLVSGKYWIDVHISKSHFDAAKDNALLIELTTKTAIQKPGGAPTTKPTSK